MYEDILCLLTTCSALWLWLCDSVIFSISWASVNLEVYVCMYGHTYLYPYIYMHIKLHVYICVSIEWREENRTVQKYFGQLKQVLLLLLQNKQTKTLKFCGYKTIIQLKSKQKIPISKILLHQNERMTKSLGYKCLASALVIKDISCKLSEMFMQPCHIISLLT